MERINISALDDLIGIYFGQDYDLFDDSEEIEPKIDAFLSASHKGMQHAVIDDIDLFLRECDDLDADFRPHHSSPENSRRPESKVITSTRADLCSESVPERLLFVQCCCHDNRFPHTNSLITTHYKPGITLACIPLCRSDGG